MSVRPRPTSPWTPERIALLKVERALGTFTKDIRAKLAALPGAPVPNCTAINSYGKWRKFPRPPTPEGPVRVEQPSRAPVLVEFDAAAEWARQQGIRCAYRADMQAVNAARIARGLAPFGMMG